MTLWLQKEILYILHSDCAVSLREYRMWTNDLKKVISQENENIKENKKMRRNLRKTIPILLIVTMLLCSMSIAFAGNEQIDVTDKSVEVEFYKEDILNGTNNEVRIVEYEDGTLEVHRNSLLNAKLLSGFDYAMTNKAGAKTLTAYYDAWVGSSESSVKLKLSNIINQDIYAELHSGVAVWSAAFNRP